MPARVFEGERVVVELGDEPDVVQQRGDVEKFVIELKVTSVGVRGGPHVGPQAVVEKRRRAVLGGHLKSPASSGR